MDEQLSTFSYEFHIGWVTVQRSACCIHTMRFFTFSRVPWSVSCGGGGVDDRLWQGKIYIYLAASFGRLIKARNNTCAMFHALDSYENDQIVNKNRIFHLGVKKRGHMQRIFTSVCSRYIPYYPSCAVQTMWTCYTPSQPWVNTSLLCKKYS